MSKLDIGVGDEFPLDEPNGEDAHMQRGPGHHCHERHHHHGYRHHNHHHGHHGFSRLAFLLVIAGLVALIVEHRLTAEIAYGMIGLGAGLLVLMVLLRVLFHWRHHRRFHQQVS